MSQQQTNTDNWEQVRHAAEAVLPDHVLAAIEKARQAPEPSGELISILHLTQGHFGYLGVEQMDAIAQLLRVPMATVSGVATFYHYFRLNKVGKYMISVCMGTACYVKGADKVLAKLQEELGIDVGETTSDGLFSLAQARCIGTCGLAPVLMVNDEVYEKVTPDHIPALLDKFVRESRGG